MERRDIVSKPTDPDGLILEAWAQGYMVGSLIIMACITISNMRRGVLLHKLILIELILGTFHGTFIFAHPPVYSWYLSVTAIFLNISWSMHNFIAWMKNKPFLSRKVSYFYIGTVILAQPYWVVEIYANFTYFNNINDIFLKTRQVEALFRDPWWIFTILNLFYVIHTQYDLAFTEIIRISPRFGVLLGSMLLSIAFIIIDILAVTHAFTIPNPDGINPFWKLAYVFKCLTDTIVLDDFKTALDKLSQVKREMIRSDDFMRFKREDDPLGSPNIEGPNLGAGMNDPSVGGSEHKSSASHLDDVHLNVYDFLNESPRDRNRSMG
ncbi:hypothetical protein H2201_004385 [Coniosporium apollinis]|uniref:Uncharacterized protein n=1 Tax=Coniosporium apollinis TaxID=61459 RepID=A0ABQ9NUA7_9PEZI|nr:hypothetical protein H2201_004385 [Coniosporium apollinis]